MTVVGCALIDLHHFDSQYSSTQRTSELSNEVAVLQTRGSYLISLLQVASSGKIAAAASTPGWYLITMYRVQMQRRSRRDMTLSGARLHEMRRRGERAVKASLSAGISMETETELSMLAT